MNTTEASARHPANVDEWNEEIFKRLLPDSVILMIYLVVGVLGNSVVLCIYIFRFKGNKQDRFFITALAFVDLMTTVTGTASSFSVNMLPVKFESGIACKVIHFVPMTLSTASASLLLVIAVNRYLKICKPFRKQITLYWKKFTLIIISGSSVLLSLPCFLFYGPKEIVEEKTNITGTRCTNIRGPWSHIEPLVFKSVMFVVAVAILFSLVILYILIGKQVFKHRNFNKKLSVHQGLNFSQVTNSSVPPSLSTAITHTTASFESISLPTETADHGTNRHCAQRDVGQRLEVRLTLIFMLISLVFIICYAPKITLMVYESRNESFWIELDLAEMGGYRFLYTLIYINNIVNPVIYGFFDRRFRQEVTSTFC
ncbi:orexin receptor type 2-like [Pecten maximus]|uniref:orexin receptor type 2-like n=1 Tax=Pecten maximus TaxID=6579 RepID=UPI001458CACB|nr:orexin receptor type 2-like [Pecten maximus]